LVDLASGSPIVTTMEVDTGVGTTKQSTEYEYRGLKAAVDGGGVFGMRMTRVQGTAPNGLGMLTNATESNLTPPYAGLAKSTETRLGDLSAFDTAATLSRTTNRYCDKTSTTAPGASTVDTPCGSAAKVKRPYLYETVETGWDIDDARTPLPTVTTVHDFDNFGNPLSINVTTKGVFDGVTRTYTKTNTNVYRAPDTSVDHWILGRIERATVNNSVPNLDLTPSAGTNPNATRTTGVGLP
jgi:hypothetical protein